MNFWPWNQTMSLEMILVVSDIDLVFNHTHTAGQVECIALWDTELLAVVSE